MPWRLCTVQLACKALMPQVSAIYYQKYQYIAVAGPVPAETCIELFPSLHVALIPLLHLTAELKLT